MTKVIDSVDFGPGIPCTHDSDLNELMRTIYAYFCYKGYPADLQANIDKVIQIFSKLHRRKKNKQLNNFLRRKRPGEWVSFSISPQNHLKTL